MHRRSRIPVAYRSDARVSRVLRERVPQLEIFKAPCSANPNRNAHKPARCRREHCPLQSKKTNLLTAWPRGRDRTKNSRLISTSPSSWRSERNRRDPKQSRIPGEQIISYFAGTRG